MDIFAVSIRVGVDGRVVGTYGCFVAARDCFDGVYVVGAYCHTPPHKRVHHFCTPAGMGGTNG